jgi:hypothetical protein
LAAGFVICPAAETVIVNRHSQAVRKRINTVCPFGNPAAFSHKPSGSTKLKKGSLNQCKGVEAEVSRD